LWIAIDEAFSKYSSDRILLKRFSTSDALAADMMKNAQIWVRKMRRSLKFVRWKESNKWFSEWTRAFWLIDRTRVSSIVCWTRSDDIWLFNWSWCDESSIDESRVNVFEMKRLIRAANCNNSNWSRSNDKLLDNFFNCMFSISKSVFESKNLESTNFFSRTVLSSDRSRFDMFSKAKKIDVESVFEVILVDVLSTNEILRSLYWNVLKIRLFLKFSISLMRILTKFVIKEIFTIHSNEKDSIESFNDLAILIFSLLLVFETDDELVSK
jgi:hypothetical protein